LEGEDNNRTVENQGLNKGGRGGFPEEGKLLGRGGLDIKRLRRGGTILKNKVEKQKSQEAK